MREHKIKNMYDVYMRYNIYTNHTNTISVVCLIFKI